jgi:hypothetical protein
MYTVATHLVEVKTQKEFSKVLRESFFEPLDMQSSSLQPSEARERGLAERIATGYCWKEDESSYVGFEAEEVPESQGAGSVITSVNDFIKFIKALINREGPISEKLYHGLIRMRSIMDPAGKWTKRHTSPSFYASGMEVSYYRGHVVISHGGMVDGFSSRFVFMPDLKFGAFVVGNSTECGPVSSIVTKDLIDEVIKLPGEERSFHRKKAATRKTKLQDRDEFKSKKSRNKKKSGVNQNKKSPGDSQMLSDSQEMPLMAYTGQYRNPGYHTLTVQINDDELFIDATDRSFGFAVTFEHKAKKTEYIAHMRGIRDDSDDPIEARFELKDDRAVKLGLDLEPAMKELIWFERVD